MPKNDFKPFAISENANVLKQSEYEALDALGGGFQAGIARSEELNKVWRQASTIASVVASFMANKANEDVLDNGDVNTLQDILLKALLNNSTSQLDNRYLKAASNLSDLNNAGSARSNLGLGKLAVKDSLTAADVGALTQSDGDARYVNVDGDTMNGDLSTPNLTAGTVTATNGNMAIRAAFQGGNQYSRHYFLSADGTIVLANLEADFGRNLVFNINGRRFIMDKDGNMFVPGGVYDAGQRVFSPNYLPTANQTGALPIGGGTLNGPLLVKGQISTDTGYNVYASQDVIAGNGGVYEGGKRVYSPNNPPTSASLGTNGWWRDNVTGMIKQWVNNITIPVGTGSEISVPVNFPIAFPNRCLSVLVSLSYGSGADMIGWTNASNTSVSVIKSGRDMTGRTVNIEVTGY